MARGYINSDFDNKIVDEITTDIMNIEDTLIKGIEQGTLI